MTCVIDDLGIMLVAGRVKDPRAALHANRTAERPMPRYRPVVATLTLAGLRVSELCALNCEHVDLARRELRVLDAKTPAGARRVDIHDDLQDELAAYKAARPTLKAEPS